MRITNHDWFMDARTWYEHDLQKHVACVTYGQIREVIKCPSIYHKFSLSELRLVSTCSDNQVSTVLKKFSRSSNLARRVSQISC